MRRASWPLLRRRTLDPEKWAPQNHSCDSNTAFRGLDVVALRDIAAGEELTLDYAMFCDESMTPFDCQCGSAACRGRIRGRPGNSVPQARSSLTGASGNEWPLGDSEHGR